MAESTGADKRRLKLATFRRWTGKLFDNDYSAQNGETNLPIALPENIWTFARGSEPVRELTIFTSRLGQTLSILLFDDVPERDYVVEPREWDTCDQFRWRG